MIIVLIIGIRMAGLYEYLTLENLQSSKILLANFVAKNYSLAVITYIISYIIITALSLPGAAIMTLAGGFLFGIAIGALYVNIGATFGATGAFLCARYLLGDFLQKKYAPKLQTFNDEITTNGYSYLLTLRFIPVFPFFLINILTGLTRIPLATFIWTTSLGIIPGSLAYTFAGHELNRINSLTEILSPHVILAFCLLAGLALLPLLIKKIRA